MIINIKGHELEFDEAFVEFYEVAVCDNFASSAETRLATNYHEADIDKIFREHTEQEIKNLIIKTALMEIDLYTGGSGSGCTKTPDYKINDAVEFSWGTEIKRGYVNIVDKYGTFEQWEEPSYDILVPEDEGVYKHIRESLIRKNSTYKVFNGKKSLSIPVDILLEYEEKVSTFTENTANYLMVVLELTEDMTEDELSAAVVAAMKEDCEDSEFVKEILSDTGHLMNEIVKSLNKCSVVMLLGTESSGKTSCLYKMEQTMASTKYIDFKGTSEAENKILLNDVLTSIAQNKPIIYLLDNFSFAHNPEHFLNVVENELTGKAYPDKIKIVFASTNSSAMEKLFCKTFCGCHACIIGTYTN